MTNRGSTHYQKFGFEWNQSEIAKFSRRKGAGMQNVVDKVMQTYGMMNSLTEREADETREVLLDFLSKRLDTDEHKAAVDSLVFLRNLRT